jgi:prepilin-type processing-associated H-X9-DG protein
MLIATAVVCALLAFVVQLNLAFVVILSLAASVLGLCFGATRNLGAVLASGSLFLILSDVPPAARTGSIICTREAACLCNLKQLGLAFHMYHDQYGSFPPAYSADSSGKPLHSWRTLILPYIEQAALHGQFDFGEAWDGANNFRPSNTSVEVFSCPSSGNFTAMETNYFAVTGPNAAWPGARSLTISDFNDGISNTILVIEVAHAGVAWSEPKDFTAAQVMALLKPAQGAPQLESHPGGFHALFADGSVRYISSDISPATLQSLLTINGGEKIVNY